MRAARAAGAMRPAYAVRAPDGLPLEGGLLVVAVPRAGFAGVLAAEHVTKALAMRPSGGVFGPVGGGALAVANGRPAPLVALHAAAGRKERLVVVLAEREIGPDHGPGIASALARFAHERGARAIVVLDGIVTQDEAADDMLWSVASDDVGAAVAREAGIEPLGGGTLGGICAWTLEAAMEEGVSAVVLLAETDVSNPDVAAAARLVATLGKLLPGARLDAEPLHATARELESSAAAAEAARRER